MESIDVSYSGLSAVQDSFLDFVARHPAALERASFAPVLAHDEFVYYDPQPWPVFLDGARRSELARASVAVSRLVRSVPARIFQNDPARLAAYFGLDPGIVQLTMALVESSDILKAAFGRGDFIETEEGHKCVELNLTSNLGGWESKVWRDRCLSVPLIRQFIAESGTTVASIDSVRMMFEHVVTLCRDLAEGGELNVALALTGTELPPQPLVDYLANELRQVLAASSLRGSLSFGRMTEFTERQGTLRLGDRRIHGVIELAHGAISSPLFTAAIRGGARVYNGPACLILSNKLNLALLSENAESDLFTAEERRDIEAFVPWTRRVASGMTSWRGERASLADLVIDRREHLVLKPSDALGGEGVLLGNRTAPAEWSAAVAKALAARNWLVQELLVPKPYRFQSGESGAAPHDLVWGLYTLGDRYAGCYVRMLRSDSATGVVNAGQGASPAIVIDIADGPATPVSLR